MSQSLVTQILIGVGVAMVIRLVLPAPAPVVALPVQTWAGAGTDPFGMGYTVAGKAARGGL